MQTPATQSETHHKPDAILYSLCQLLLLVGAAQVWTVQSTERRELLQWEHERCTDMPGTIWIITIAQQRSGELTVRHAVLSGCARSGIGAVM